MATTDLPLAAAPGSALAPATAERATCAPLDRRQLSHELRTPLNAILGNTELLLDGSSGPLSAQARACLGDIQTAARQLLRHVQVLLAWSELWLGEPPLSEGPVDLIALVREALTTTRPDAVQVEPHDARPLVWGDRSRLQMLVAAVLALDGARGAAPRLKLETRAGDIALCFAWSGFCAARTGALQIALIETIARAQHAELALTPDGVSLLWPRQRPEGPEATGSTDDPS